jgi:hypothetical protein
VRLTGRSYRIAHGVDRDKLTVVSKTESGEPAGGGDALIMQTGVYRKIHGRTGVGQLYEFDCLCRHHTTGEEMVVYIPLRVEPEWAGTVRHCVLERVAFEKKFVHVGEGLPDWIGGTFQ